MTILLYYLQGTASRSQTDIAYFKPSSTKQNTHGSRYMDWYKKKTIDESGQSKEKRTRKKQVPRNKSVPSTSASKNVVANIELVKKENIDSTKSVNERNRKPLIQHSRHRFENQLPVRRSEDDVDSGIALARPPMAEKKSVFSIAYADIQRQTKQLRPESSNSKT